MTRDEFLKDGLISRMGFLQNLFNGPFGILYGVLVIVCLIHAISRRADFFWYFIIFFIPYIGALVYFFSNVLPDLRGARVLEAVNELKPAGMRVRDLEKQLEELDTAQNRLLLAVAYKDAGQLDRAETMLTQTRQGIFKSDPHVTYDLADVKFQLGKLEEARALLRELVDNAPEELRGKTRLLLARAIQSEQPEEADALFQRAISSFSGEEARYWYAAFLFTRGDREAAESQVKTLERNIKRASGSYRYQQREWLERASKLLK
jgi:hypothetical protein